MVTKVGRSRTMLICTDCGLPADQREITLFNRQRLRGALALVAMGGISCLMLVLATLSDSRNAARLAGFRAATDDRSDDRSGEDDNGRNQRWMLEPSGLLPSPLAMKEAKAAPSAPQPKAKASQQEEKKDQAREHQR
jgi:hypothetical protein